MIENIFCLIFILRPLIDLFWESTSFFGVNLASLIAVINIGLMVCYYLKKKTLSVDNVAITALVFVIYVGTITMIFMQELDDLAYFLRILSAIPYYVIVAKKNSKEKFEKCLLIYVCISLVPIIISYLQLMGVVDYTYFDYVSGVTIFRASGGYRQPASLTRVCVFSLIYVLYFLETKIRFFKHKLLVYIYLLLNIGAVFISYHRTGYAMLIIVLLLWLYMKNRANFMNFLRKTIIAVCFVLIVFLVAYVTGIVDIDLSVLQTMLSVDNIFVVENGTFELTLRGRNNLIDKLIAGFELNPWYNTLFGNGIASNSVSGISMQVADMDFIRVLWNTGVVGFVIYNFHYLSLYQKLKCIKRQLSNGNVLYRVSVCIFVIVLMWGVTLETSNTPNIVYHLYFIIGFVYYNTKRELKLRLLEGENDRNKRYSTRV